MSGAAWTHVTENSSTTRSETWYSPSEDVSAWRRGDWIEFHDHKQNVYYSFDARAQVLYRVPVYTPRRATYFGSIADTLRLVFQDNRPPANLLERLEFLGNQRAEMELVHQSINRVVEGGLQWLDFRLTVRHRNSTDEMKWLFRADPDTKQLQRVRIDGTHDGQAFFREMRFDNPDTGPASIYDLGVPRSVTVVDRVPSDDIQRISDTLRADRLQMDNYRAIIVGTMPDSEWWWCNDRPMVMYRKGDKFRVDTPMWLGDYPRVDKPDDGTDMETWWRQRVGAFIFCPFYVSSNSAVYHVSTQPVTDELGIKHIEVEKVEQRKECGKPGNVFPSYWSRLPEFACRPPLGIPSRDREPVIITSPADGPAGSILLEVRQSGQIPTCCGSSCSDRPQPNVHRFWLDPLRDFAVLRSDMVHADESGDETLVHSTLIEEMSQSPNGIWHATRMRIKAVAPVIHDEVFHFYLDFNVDSPDSLFEPPQVGQRYA